MDLWGWIHEFIRRARLAGDTVRASMDTPFHAATPLFDSNPDQALLHLEQGKNLAEQLGEKWWSLFYDHWRLQVLLFFKRDYVAALDLAVRSAVEVRKSAYEMLPQRICLHEDLINAYEGTDPVGNAADIENALEYMQKQVTPDLPCRFCLQGLRISFALDLNRVEEAKRETERYLSMDNIDPHYYSAALLYACEIGYLQKDWLNIISWAEEGAQVCRRQRQKSELAEFMAWHALAMRNTGQDLDGARLYLAAVAQGSRLGAVPAEGYYNALAAYHELGENWSMALEIRGRELENLKDKGQTWRQCQCHLNRCRLLKKLGQSLDAEGSALREVAQNLKDPTPVLAQLDRIERG